MTEYIEIAGRPREQPQGRLAAHPEAPDHDLHRRLGLGQVVDRLRHDRDRGPAPALRELQLLHPQLPAALPAAGRRRDREPEHGGHRRPEAARRRLALDGRHDHRHLHRCCACSSRASASRTSATRTRSRSTTRRACAPSATASAGRSASSVGRLHRHVEVAQRGRDQGPVLVDLGARQRTRPSGFFDNDKKLADYTPEELDLLLYGKDRKYKLQIGDGTMNATYLGRHREARALVRPARHQDASERTQKTVEPYPPRCGRARCARARG